MKTEDRHKHSRTAIFLEEDRALPLRDLAAALDLYITRGIGSGKIGNVKAVVVCLIDAYRRDPDAVLATLKEWQRSGPGSPVPD